MKLNSMRTETDVCFVLYRVPSVWHMAQINVWWMRVEWICQSYFCKRIVSSGVDPAIYQCRSSRKG